MPTNNRVSLNNKSAIFALRGEGYSLCKIRRELDIKRRAEKNILSTVNFTSNELQGTKDLAL